MNLNTKVYLNPEVFNTAKLEQKPTRDGYGQGLVAAGEDWQPTENAALDEPLI